MTAGINGSSSSNTTTSSSSLSNIRQEVPMNWDGRQVVEDAVQSLHNQAQTVAKRASGLFSGLASFVQQITASKTTTPNVVDGNEEIKGIKTLPKDDHQITALEKTTPKVVESNKKIKRIKTLPKDAQQIKASKTTTPKIFNIDEEIKRIKTLPAVIQEEVGSFIDPINDLLKLVKEGAVIPEYLKHHARHVTDLDMSKTGLSASQVIRMLDCCKNVETLKLPETLSSHDPLSGWDTKGPSDIHAKLQTLKNLDPESNMSIDDITQIGEYECALPPETTK